MPQKEYAIIVAGGKGTRMPGAVPKQFLELNGLPILMHTVNAFYKYSESLQVILVLPVDDLELWQSLCVKHAFNKPCTIQAGGETRFQSVKNGLSKIAEDGIVAIHDGVRPLVTPEMIATSFNVARENMSAVAAVSLKESIREINKNNSIALDRSRYRLIQTPQTFDVKLIRSSYALPEDKTMTDDASIAEKAGYKISLFEGSYQNIKITTTEDMVVAESLLKTRS